MNISQTISHTSPQSHSSSSSSPQACAACKYRRRKCASDCILAPYFPLDRQSQFLNAHKLFGVRKITKIIEHLDPHDQDQAMRSIIFQSDMRAKDPVGGCYRYIQELQMQIDLHRAERDLVLQQLAIVRSHHHTDHQLNLNCANYVHPPAHHDHHYANYVHHNQELAPQQQEAEAYNMMVNQDRNHLQEDVNSWEVHQQDSMSLSSLMQSKNYCGGGYNVGDELLYDANNNNDNKSPSPTSCLIELGFEADELVERCSDETVLFKIHNAVVKEEANCIQQVRDHDLKGAANLFTLTNCAS